MRAVMTMTLACCAMIWGSAFVTTRLTTVVSTVIAQEISQ